MLKETLQFVREIKQAANIKVGRHFDDFFTSRIVQATTESTLMSAMERLAKSVNADGSKVFGKTVAGMVAAAASEESLSILEWMRRHPRVVSMVASLKSKDDFEQTLEAIAPQIKTVAQATGSVCGNQPSFDIPIKAELLSPLAHGSDGKAGNATLFRRRQAITDSGSVVTLPFYAGNAIRGQIRDLLADHLLLSLGYTPRRDKPPCAIWFFHALYAGGVLEEQSKTMDKINAELGKHGGLRTDGLRRVRDMLPGLSLLGAAIGNRILPGRVCVSDLRPHCREWGLAEIPAAELFDWEYLTRREDYEGRGENDDHTGMIAMTEVLRSGVIMSGGVDIDRHASELERSALGMGLSLLKERSMLGAENRRGFGKVFFTMENVPDPALYQQYLSDKADLIREYLEEIGAASKDLNKEEDHASCESDSQSPGLELF